MGGRGRVGMSNFIDILVVFAFLYNVYTNLLVRKQFASFESRLLFRRKIQQYWQELSKIYPFS